MQNWCAQKVRIMLPNFACELEMLLGVDWYIGELLKCSRSRDMSQPFLVRLMATLGVSSVGARPGGAHSSVMPIDRRLKLCEFAFMFHFML